MMKKKIFVVFSSASGHVNPVCGLIHELCRNPNIECIFYGIEEHRELIEKTGAQFRLYVDRNVADTIVPQVDDQKSEPVFSRFMNRMMDSSYQILPQLTRDFETEKPDIVLIDPSFIVARYLVEILKSSNIKVKCVEFFPHFVMTQAMMESVPGLIRKDFLVIRALLYLFLRQIVLSWYFGIWVFNPLSLIMGKNYNLKLVSVFQELHPRIDEYDRNYYKFIGNCASEQSRNSKLDDELKSFLSNDSKIIYMSLGTVYNNNLFIFGTLIEAMRKLDKRSQIKVIISMGDSGLAAFREKFANGELNDDNILLRAKVPQLEVLKRADLFITHCGMNSASETIKYAVPIIGVPIEGDQLIVSRRLCDELGIGIRLEPIKITADELADAIDRVLSDEIYREKVHELSKVSEKYNGQIEGARIIIDYLEQNEHVKSN
jgi:MGT family glycosyltransferase